MVCFSSTLKSQMKIIKVVSYLIYPSCPYLSLKLFLSLVFLYIKIKTREKEEIDRCLRRAAMRKVMAGTEFCMEEANVGEVLSSPNK